MPTLTSCIYENRDFTGAAHCNSVGFGANSWAWATWNFDDFHASYARVRTDSEIVIALVPVMDTGGNRRLIDGFLPDGVTRTSGIRAGMVPYSAVPYSAANPTRHPAWRALVDISFDIRIELPWYCLSGGQAGAKVHYYVHLFLNAAGNLQANVDGWSWEWTDGAGLCSGAVAGRLNSAIPTGTTPLGAALRTQLAAFSGFRFSNIYFLPGDGRNRGRDDVPEVRNESAVVLIP